MMAATRAMPARRLLRMAAILHQAKVSGCMRITPLAMARRWVSALSPTSDHMRLAVGVEVSQCRHGRSLQSIRPSAKDASGKQGKSAQAAWGQTMEAGRRVAGAAEGGGIQASGRACNSRSSLLFMAWPDLENRKAAISGWPIMYRSPMASRILWQDKFVVKAQAVFVQHRVVVDHDGVVQIAAQPQAVHAHVFDFVHKAKGARG